ncbi:MAG TPA: transposase [Dehalococcoidia bacterium]|nr:transposase [Dehalococcoidia bacterium]
MKRIRLESEAYRLGHCFSVTLATAGRTRVFAEPRAVELCLAALKQAATRCEARIYAYCFMPDHLHLLTATPFDVNLVSFIQYFKQLSAFRLSHPSPTAHGLWQTRFYDHALRFDEDIITVARYIFDNPVRAGIVADAADYPYSGSLVWKDVLCSSGSEDPDLHLNRPVNQRM